MLEQEIYKLLDKCVESFFPDTGKWYSNCFSRPSGLEYNNFPCHTRDNEWLAKMFRSKFNINYLPDSFINQYIEQSEIFNTARHDYEQRIVSWQIDWMRNGGENWIIDENLGGDFFIFSDKCDQAFRKGVVDTLSKIGMPIDAIEEGIEKNADKWRERYMKRAFENIYDPVMFGLFTQPDPNAQNRMEVSPKLRENWMKLHLYEYYQDHKDSVDKYGEVLDEMIISDEEVKELKKFVEEKGKERLEELEHLKKNSKKRSIFAFDIDQDEKSSEGNDEIKEMETTSNVPEEEEQKEKGFQKIKNLFKRKNK